MDFGDEPEVDEVPALEADGASTAQPETPVRDAGGSPDASPAASAPDASPEASAAGEGGEPPERKKWKKKLVKTLVLEEWKENEMVDTIPLGEKKKYMFGRDKHADVTLMHPSISREHAAIVHGVHPDTELPVGDDGKPIPGVTLIDMKTSNGTFVSARFPCAGEAKKKVLPGNGTLLKEGMCIRFGSSTRNYVVRGLSKDSRVIDMARASKAGKDLGIANDDLDHRSKGGKQHVSGVKGKNPFAEHAEAPTAPAQLVKVNEELANAAQKREFAGEETTFSFHKRQKVEMAQIQERHKANQKKVQQELRNVDAFVEKKGFRDF